MSAKQVSDENITSIQKQIYMKNGYNPFFGTVNGAESIITDMDHYPYTRFYRGVYNSSLPTIFEREAGYRPRNDTCYIVKKCLQSDKYPNHCFKSACSTLYPCNPKSIEKDSLVQTNSNCIKKKLKNMV